MFLDKNKQKKRNKQSIYIYIYVNKYNHPWKQPGYVILIESAPHFDLAGIRPGGSSREIHSRWSSLFGVLRCGRCFSIHYMDWRGCIRCISAINVSLGSLAPRPAQRELFIAMLPVKQ